MGLKRFKMVAEMKPNSGRIVEISYSSNDEMIKCFEAVKLIGTVPTEELRDEIPFLKAFYKVVDDVASKYMNGEVKGIAPILPSLDKDAVISMAYIMECLLYEIETKFSVRIPFYKDYLVQHINSKYSEKNKIYVSEELSVEEYRDYYFLGFDIDFNIREIIGDNEINYFCFHNHLTKDNFYNEHQFNGALYSVEDPKNMSDHLSDKAKNRFGTSSYVWFLMEILDKMGLWDDDIKYYSMWADNCMKMWDNDAKRYLKIDTTFYEDYIQNNRNTNYVHHPINKNELLQFDFFEYEKSIGVTRMLPLTTVEWNGKIQNDYGAITKRGTFWNKTNGDRDSNIFKMVNKYLPSKNATFTETYNGLVGVLVKTSCGELNPNFKKLVEGIHYIKISDTHFQYDMWDKNTFIHMYNVIFKSAKLKELYGN